MVTEFRSQPSSINPSLIPILNLRCQLILGEFNLLTLVLAPKGKPNGLKDYNNFNKVNTKMSYPLLTIQLQISK